MAYKRVIFDLKMIAKALFLSKSGKLVIELLQRKGTLDINFCTNPTSMLLIMVETVEFRLEKG